MRRTEQVLSGSARVTLVVLAIACLVIFQRAAAAQDTGWTIERFQSDIAIQQDASIEVTETIDVDFGGLQKHGIFREIPVRYDYNKEYERVYDLHVNAVTKADGTAWPYSQERAGANVRLKIGDPHSTISGRQSYRIAYRVGGALNAFPDHDELYWNVNGGDWTVPLLATAATVRLADGLERGACFQGYAGTTQTCRVTETPGQLDYAATIPFQPGQQLTVVSGIR